MADREFSPLAMMKKAIEVMLQSVAEPRNDAKASPKVEAVLIVPRELAHGRDSLITACRGELRDGDHAEFTLIERKCREWNLTGSSLFATLEPCAPGSRSERKLSCAERIVLARIKEVWIGLEDPDPTVAGKGKKYLEDNGIKVHMFDRELQEQIREANADFLAQAIERAAAAQEEEKPRPIMLSPLEEAFALAEMGDLSTEALEQYRKVARIEDAVGTPAFHRRLALQGLLKEESSRWVPTGFGLLLFGKEPRLHMPQAGLLGTIHFSDDREEPRDFIGPQILAPDQAIKWLRDKLPDPVDRTEARRKPVNEALFELAREGIVNALVHRDYGIEGAKCQLIATPDTITVMSPGQPAAPITLEQMQNFTAPMLSRNPILHSVFSQMDLAEERGLGLHSMKQKAEKAGLPLPVYTWNDPYLVLTLYRTGAAAIPADLLDSLNESDRAGWKWLATKEEVSSGEYAEALGVPNRTALNHLKRFVDLGLLKRIGSGRATRYRVRR